MNDFQTYGAGTMLTDVEGNISDASDAAVSGKSVTRLTVHFHHSSYYHGEGTGCCHVWKSCW